MRCQLNVTLLKAVLQIHAVVTLMEERLARGHVGSQVMAIALTEADVLENLRWKQNQVVALIAASDVSL